MNRSAFYRLDNLLSDNLASRRGPKPKNWDPLKVLNVETKGEDATIHIYDQIGFWGINPDDVVDRIRDIKAKKITLRVNSPGGSVFDGLAIMTLLAEHDAEIVAKVDGLAASIASVILHAGNSIIMPENTRQMIHNPWVFTAGDSRQLRSDAELLDMLKEDILTTYRKNATATRAELSDLMDAETWLSAAKSKEVGLATEVTKVEREDEGENSSATVVNNGVPSNNENNNRKTNLLDLLELETALH